MGVPPCAASSDRRMAASAAAEDLRGRQILVRLLKPVASEAATLIADQLIERFGSLQGILTADAAARAIFLSQEHAAAEQLEAVQEAMLQAAQAVVRANPLFPGTLAAADYLMIRMACERSEQIHALFLDSRHMLIRDECVMRGSTSEATVYPREIVRRALELGAASLILAHNHPSGDLTPSKDDIAATRRLIKACSAVDIQVLDHLIVARSGCLSFRAEGLIV